MCKIIAEVCRMNESCVRSFESIFGYAPRLCCFAPGRVNLIGEHTDYNGGLVLPCAISFGIFCAASERSDGLFRLYSCNFPDDGIVTAALPEPSAKGWAAYPAGVIRALADMGFQLEKGADMLFAGDLPDGAGLSSSAALEVVTAAALSRMFSLGLSGKDMALCGQRCENRYIGLSCGIMDQFISAMGKRGYALLLDTETLEYSYTPLREDEAKIVIVNSRVKHSLASSAYNQRRMECETALEALRERFDVPSLCALTPEEFDGAQRLIKDEVCRRRARHAIYENARTKQAAKALADGDISLFGRLMNDSHISLRDDYEVSCRELDILAETAWETEGVLGARMTGGGFGGCTVNLVRTGFAESFAERIRTVYMDKTGIEPVIYTPDISSGAVLSSEE